MDDEHDLTQLNHALAGLARKTANQMANNALFFGDF
jgi:hypothetical protein